MDELIPPQGPAKAASPAVPQPSPQAPEQAEEQPNVSPEEQEQYDQVVDYAMEYLYGPGAEQLLARVRQQPDDPGQAIGRVVAMLGQTVAQTAEEAGDIIDDSVMLHAAGEVIDQALEIAESAGIIEDSPEIAEKALYHATKMFGEGVEVDEARKGEVSADMSALGLTPGAPQQGPPQQPAPQQPPQPPPQGMPGV